jgi:Right handed beta helix region
VRVGEAGGKSVVALVAALIALACALALPAVAAAESFEVNSIADETDAIPGDEFCLTGVGECTLRAALEESNALEGEDTIGFTEAPFDGGIGGTIALGSSLPTIVGVVSIEGECVVADGLRPCVGMEGPGPSEPALVVENTEAVQVDGLAMTGAKTGIEVVGTPRFKALSDWLGVKLDGTTGANGTGILLGPGSNNSRIGNGGEANVFANSSVDGLDIHGARGVTVLGGYFGVRPDGATPAPNGKDIEVASFAGFEAAGTTIGAQLATAARESPECDGGCNVISGSKSSGIDLEGDGGEEAPAIATEIVGNYVGLDASGSASVPNATAGIHVGQASGTVIGGPRASEANRFGGGGVGVDAGAAAANLVVRGNSIGVGADGESLAAPKDGVVIDSGGLFGPAAEAVVADNEIRMGGGVAIDLSGFGGWIVGNAISGADIGISTYDPTEEHGNLIQGNLIEGSAIDGVLVESSFNEILGNEILGSGGSGISLEGTHTLFGFGVSGNRVGGDGDADENLIAGSGGAAIAITNLTNTSNEVARNRGFANGGKFIALVKAAPAEKEGPNKGVKPPTVSIATDVEAGGFDAEAGARIRVFRKASGEAGEIESFLGEAIADEEGEWALAYESPPPAGAIIAATQTAEGGTSELATATVPTATVPAASAASAAETGSHGCPASGGCGPGPAVDNPPTTQTKIFKGPKGKRFVGVTAAFKFKASVDRSTFQCRLDGKTFAKCHSPQVYTGLKPGRHRFEVRALDSAGRVDPTPAKLKFTVLG